MSKREIPSPEEFFKEIPFYKKFHFTNRSAIFDIDDIRRFKGTIDSYCIDCKRESTFKGTQTERSLREVYAMVTDISSPPPPKDFVKGIFFISLVCTREPKHKQIFIFNVDNDTILKIGQYPSIADINIVKIKKYKSILGNDSFKDFSRAIGLFAHGIGIGSFVYLRRIFESLIEKYHTIAKSKSDWNKNLEVKFNKSRMDEKIKILKSYLPKFLVEKRLLYAILSKGVHSLSEEECLEYFPIVKIGIELILDEEHDKKEKELKIKQASKDISKIHQKLMS